MSTSRCLVTAFNGGRSTLLWVPELSPCLSYQLLTATAHKDWTAVLWLIHQPTLHFPALHCTLSLIVLVISRYGPHRIHRLLSKGSTCYSIFIPNPLSCFPYYRCCLYILPFFRQYTSIFRFSLICSLHISRSFTLKLLRKKSLKVIYSTNVLKIRDCVI
jgi:hypothetical protein